MAFPIKMSYWERPDHDAYFQFVYSRVTGPTMPAGLQWQICLPAIMLPRHEKAFRQTLVGAWDAQLRHRLSTNDRGRASTCIARANSSSRIAAYAHCPSVERVYFCKHESQTVSLALAAVYLQQ